MFDLDTVCHRIDEGQQRPHRRALTLVDGVALVAATMVVAVILCHVDVGVLLIRFDPRQHIGGDDVELAISIYIG